VSFASVVNWRTAIGVGAVLLLVGFSAPPAAELIQNVNRHRLINSDEYKAQHGKWETITLPGDHKINAVHAALLPSGRILLIAGSGNDKESFEAGQFSTVVYDPSDGYIKQVKTPEDMFCAGHAHLAGGNLLVAGGTQGYEKAAKDVTNAGGYVTIRNETPGKSFVVPKGTTLTGLASGRQYRSDSEVVVPAATVNPRTRKVAPTDRNVFVEAVIAGAAGVSLKGEAYRVELAGLSPADRRNLHGFAPKMTLEKKEYQGTRYSYEFNPVTEEYERVGDMNYARWYPTLTTLPNGTVLALSGLDNSGRILDGQNEIYDPKTKQWTERGGLKRFFPTYPAVFQTARDDVLFFAGPSTGWGPAESGREPGLWNLKNNTFAPVPGLRDPDQLETGSSTWIGPVNDQRLVVVGGGGIGNSPLSTERIDVIDLKNPAPRFEPFGELADGTRYPSLVPLPSGDVFITGGSRDYRGGGDSDLLKSYVLTAGGQLTAMADPGVGRNYHSSAILLPNGQILTMGSDPLFSDKANSLPGEFEQRLEIYTPSYLFRPDGKSVSRIEVSDGPAALPLGGSGVVTLDPGSEGATIASARLVLPAATTHVTDTNQRVVDVGFVQDRDKVTVTLPTERALLPKGSYMLFFNDTAGVPSIAKWVQVE